MEYFPFSSWRCLIIRGKVNKSNHKLTFAVGRTWCFYRISLIIFLLACQNNVSSISTKQGVAKPSIVYAYSTQILLLSYLHILWSLVQLAASKVKYVDFRMSVEQTAVDHDKDADHLYTIPEHPSCREVRLQHQSRVLISILISESHIIIR